MVFGQIDAVGAALLVIALWVLMAWVHDIAATHSVFLVATSAEPDSGKTTLLGVVRYLVPKAFLGGEATGPSIYHSSIAKNQASSSMRPTICSCARPISSTFSISLGRAAARSLDK
jgi:hypothetical protein